MEFPSVEELAGWIRLSDEESVRALHARAYAVKEEVVGRRVSMRGLIEAGNFCAKDCLYCGIRKSNANLERYQLSKEEIVACARFAAESGYGSVVIQSGEIEGEAHTRFIEAPLARRRRDALPPAHRDVEPRALRRAPSVGLLVRPPRRMPARPAPLRLPGGDGRDDGPAGADA